MWVGNLVRGLCERRRRNRTVFVVVDVKQKGAQEINCTAVLARLNLLINAEGLYFHGVIIFP
jgi:hypothetical protein